MIRKKISGLLILYLWSSTLFSQSISKSQWLSDIDYLQKTLPVKHIDYFTVKTRKEFNESIEKVKSDIENLNDLAVAFRLQQVIASFGDSHTRVNWTKMADATKRLPIGFNWFSDGIFIYTTTKNYENQLGNKLLKIGNVPVQAAIDSLSSLITVDNYSLVKRDLPAILAYAKVLEYFKFIDSDTVHLDLWDPVTGDTLEDQLFIIPVEKPDKSEYVALTPKRKRMYVPDYGKYFDSEYIPDEQIYYIQYNRCWSRELEEKYGDQEKAQKLPSFEDFEEKVLIDIKKDSITKLIFDLRANGGGNSLQGTEFIEKLYSLKKVRKEMKVYVLIGRNTFSSAVLNVLDFREFSNVVIVGEETSGKPNHFGEVERFALPNSGLEIAYSTKFFRRTAENSPSIKPDVFITLSISEFLNGDSPSYEYVKAQ